MLYRFSWYFLKKSGLQVYFSSEENLDIPAQKLWQDVNPHYQPTHVVVATTQPGNIQLKEHA